jgi:DNA end-binding protein Ku
LLSFCALTYHGRLLAKGEIDPEMVAIAETIIERRSGAFELASFRDRYQHALRELVEAKSKGLATSPRAIAEPPKVINLMEALKRRLARDAEPEPKEVAVSRPTRAKAVADRRQRALPGGRKKLDTAVVAPAAPTAPKRRKKG